MAYELTGDDVRAKGSGTQRKAAKTLGPGPDLVLQLTLALAAGFVVATPLPASAALDFDQVFATRGEPESLHFRVRYDLHGVTHQLEVWRDGERRLRRRTDDAIETLVIRDRPGPDWQVTVLDLKRKVRTDVDRSNLSRLGVSTDWFGLAHGLHRPAGAFVLIRSSAPAAEPAPVADCRWYALQRDGRESRICWSQRYRVPLMIVNGRSAPEWQVELVESTRAAGDTFRIRDQGFVRNDADQDIHGE